MRCPQRRRMALRVASSWIAILAMTLSLQAAEVVRAYPLGEDDRGADINAEAAFTSDIVEFLADQNSDDGFADLDGVATYVAGRPDSESKFAMSFNGTTDFFTGPAFDPRHFGGSFTALSQGWVKPAKGGEGLVQTIWALGGDNGGVGITEDGFWQLNSGGSAGSLVSETKVGFDEWVHLAVLRGGNNGTLYLNGSVIARNDGFWNGPGPFYLGIGHTEENPFEGVVDDFFISGFGDGSFDPIADIFIPRTVSDVLGDVDPLQDGIVNQTDYNIWSQNVGFSNGLGVGDFSTLVRGDADGNGRVNFFDFEIIRVEALKAGNVIVVPEPAGFLVLLLTLSILTTGRSRVRNR